MKLTIAVIYLFFFTITLFVVAGVWHACMADHYFATSNRGYINDFFPPFVRGDGDAYFRPATTVYTIWGAFAGVTVLLPAVATWLILRMHTIALKRA